MCSGTAAFIAPRSRHRRSGAGRGRGRGPAAPGVVGWSEGCGCSEDAEGSEGGREGLQAS